MTADSRFDPLQVDPPPKPRRSWRKRLAIAFLLLLFAAGGSFAAWYGVCKSARDAEIAKVRAKGEPVWFEELKPAPVDPDKDGMPILRQAFAVMKPLPEELADEMRSLHAPDEEPEDAVASAKFLEESGDLLVEPEGIKLRDWLARHEKDQPEGKTPRPPLAVREQVLVEKLRPLVAANQASYELVKAAIAKPQMSCPLDFTHISPTVMDRADVDEFGEVQELFAARMRCELYEGNRTAAVVTLTDSLRLTCRRYAASDVTILDPLYTAANAGSLLLLLAEILSHGDLDASALTELDRVLVDLESRLRFRSAIVGERAATMTTIENFCEAGGFDGKPITNPIARLVLQPLIWNNQTHYLRASEPLVDFADRYGDEAATAIAEAWEREMAPLEDGKVGAYGKLSRTAVALRLPATAIVVKSVPLTRNRLNAARVGLRVDAFFREHGRLPKALDEIAGKDFAIPRDIVQGESLVLVLAENAFAICPADDAEREQRRLTTELRRQSEANAPLAKGDLDQEDTDAAEKDEEPEEEDVTAAFQVIYRPRPSGGK